MRFPRGVTVDYERSRFAHRVCIALATAAIIFTLTTLVWGFAQYRPLEDDRPTIRVKGGSIYFIIEPKEGTEAVVWSKDRTRDEWKPNQSGVSDAAFYMTTVEPATACPVATMTGTEVEIDHGEGTSVTRFRLKIRKKQLFGKKEPKLQPLSRVVFTGVGSKSLTAELAGRLLEVRVKGYEPCKLPDKAELLIQPRKK
jgi:hypothetical protein